MKTETLSIERMGALGDGVADTPSGLVHVPFALPGETVVVHYSGRRCRVSEFVISSPERVEPTCGHFGTCGGCSVQHLESNSYAEWKRGIVVQALRTRGIDTELDTLVPCLPGSRRRAAFSFAVRSGSVRLGFKQMRSHQLADVAECPVLVPAISSRLHGLRRLAGIVGASARSGRMVVNSTSSGLDVDIAMQIAKSPSMPSSIADLLAQNDIARLSINGQPALEIRKPHVVYGKVSVTPPPAGFLQASAAAEEAMAGLITAHLDRSRRVADLFSGSGTFTFRLAPTASVHAVEADTGSHGALLDATRRASGLKPVTAERRDLFRRPLTARELEKFDAIVFDPPRAGAEAQAKIIAKSRVPRVVAVSCSPGTLARDLRLLVDGGYRVERIVPIDQFLWSHHVESVALLSRR